MATNLFVIEMHMIVDHICGNRYITLTSPNYANQMNILR